MAVASRDLWERASILMEVVEKDETAGGISICRN
jgi:hypothetical protein